MFNVKAKDVVVTCRKEDLQNGRFLSNKEFLIDNHVLTFSSKLQMLESVFNIDNAFHLGDMTLYCDSIRPASEAEKQEGSGFAEEAETAMQYFFDNCLEEDGSVKQMGSTSDEPALLPVIYDISDVLLFVFHNQSSGSDNESLCLEMLNWLCGGVTYEVMLYLADDWNEYCRKFAETYLDILVPPFA